MRTEQVLHYSLPLSHSPRLPLSSFVFVPLTRYAYGNCSNANAHTSLAC